MPVYILISISIIGKLLCVIMNEEPKSVNIPGGLTKYFE